MDSKLQFLKAVLGEDGASWLAKAANRSQELKNVLVPRTLLAWLNLAANAEFEGSIPGIDNTYLALKKTEDSFSGQISIKDEVLSFENSSLYEVAASMAVAMELDHEEPDPRLQDFDVAKLGKSIDLLVKARVITQELLAKKALDPQLGYSFQHEVDPNPKFPSVTVYAHAPNGERIGFAKFHHQAEHLVPFGVYVEDEHQRQGLASHMYKLAEGIANKKVVPSGNQTVEGSALWGGNKGTQQFGKAEPPAKVAMPIAQGAPIKPDLPGKQVGRGGDSSSVKLPTVPKPLMVAAPTPKLPKISLKLPKLKLSEKDATKSCPVCSGKQMNESSFVGCLCFRALAKSVSVDHDKAAKNFRLTFSSPWDDDALATLMESLGLK